MRIAFRASNAHLARALCYAQGWKEIDPSVEITLITSGGPKLKTGLVDHVDIGTQSVLSWDLEYTEEAIPAGTDLVILDNDSDLKYQTAMKKKTGMLVVMDDECACPKYVADVIVNPNLHAHTLDYHAKDKTELLLGTEFYPLPSGFDRFQDADRRTEERCRKVSIHLGNDEANLAQWAIRLMKRTREPFLATLSLPSDYERGEELAREIGLDERFLVADSDPNRLFSADLAIASPETFHEFVFFRTPSVLAVSGAMAISEYSSRAGIALPLDPRREDSTVPISNLMKNPDERSRMSARMLDLLDGMGRFRLAEELLRIFRDSL